jgi:signal transduction histidine kinase
LPKRIVRSIRFKLVAAVALAAGASALATYLLYYIARQIYDNSATARLLLGALHRSAFGQALIYIAAMALFVAAFLLLIRGSIRRMERIVRAVRQMEGGSLSVRIEDQPGDEIGDLSRAVNGMAEKLGRSIEEERRAEQVKRDLITSVSHDLRTPLTSVIGFQGLLMDRAHHSDEELERFASIAHKKALRLQALIDELFEYTKVSYSGLRVEKRPIDLGELIGQIAEEFYPAFGDAGLECRLSLPDEKVTVQADGELLHRLFENLLNNAAKYGAQGRFVDIALSRAPGRAVCSVTNYGQPIPQEDLQRIFQRFYRVEQSRSRKTGGTGLGLAIAANIAQLHGGSITATSGAEGTSFTVELPAADE